MNVLEIYSPETIEKIWPTCIVDNSMPLMERIVRYVRYKMTYAIKYEKDYYVRLLLYRVLGFNEEALDDDELKIRLEARFRLGFTESDLESKDRKIQEFAEIWFEI